MPPSWKSCDRNSGEVVLDENKLAGTSDYFSLGVFDVRPDQELLAYAVDYDGSERYTLRFRDLGSGDNLADVVEDVYYGSAWSGAARAFTTSAPTKLCARGKYGGTSSALRLRATNWCSRKTTSAFSYR